MPVSPYMSLLLPDVGVTARPIWATELNDALDAVDSHNHTSGAGVPVPSSGLNINADLPFGGFNATLLRSARFSDQGSALVLATDAGCLYVAGGNLYYNNGSGTAIQLTAGGALNATSIGAIGGDYGTSTASEFYTAASKTFSFTQDTNKAANLDAGTVIVREPGVASAKGVSVKSPASLAADYDLTLPSALPGSTLPLSLSSAGVVSAAQIATAQVADSAITTAKLASTVGVFEAAGSFNSDGTTRQTSGPITLACTGQPYGTGTYAFAPTGLTANAIVLALPISNQDYTAHVQLAAGGGGTYTLIVYVYTKAGTGVGVDCPFSLVIVKR